MQRQPNDTQPEYAPDSVEWQSDTNTGRQPYPIQSISESHQRIAAIRSVLAGIYTKLSPVLALPPTAGQPDEGPCDSLVDRSPLMLALFDLHRDLEALDDEISRLDDGIDL